MQLLRVFYWDIYVRYDSDPLVSRVNFPDRSSLCRFFRRYAGMSPSQYRKSIHF